jgi:hypothetical protein
MADKTGFGDGLHLRHDNLTLVITLYKPRNYIQLTLGYDHQIDLGRNGHYQKFASSTLPRFFKINALFFQKSE